jgi:UDP-2-acetamido-3-amino-2,3-dideoxy-glucuronate N-acetyltransferase
MNNDVFIHKTASVDSNSVIGVGTKIWINSQVRENVSIGKNCILSKDVYIDCNVQIGDNCKIQNGVSVYDGVTIESKVFVGPHVSFTNDKVPRAFNDTWTITKTLVKEGASLGANATIVCGITIGEYSMIAAGAVVTRSVPPFALVMGNPARIVGTVDINGSKITEGKQ